MSGVRHPHKAALRSGDASVTNRPQAARELLAVAVFGAAREAAVEARPRAARAAVPSCEHDVTVDERDEGA
jgi:hypothetical protein